MKRFIRKLIIAISILFVFVNILAANHAYKFTHFSNATEKKIKVDNLTMLDKLWVAIVGISTPKPLNKCKPNGEYKTVWLCSNGKNIQCWDISVANAKGTVILFHGYTGEKSGLLDKAEVFQNLGYNTLLVDFQGAGESDGMQVTLGYYEAGNVRDCFSYISSKGERNIILFGTSMGAAAILNAINKYDIAPSKIVIECPFATMRDAVIARFKIMKLPQFPLADILMFWGSVENGFWGYAHQPKEYAKSVKCPVLMMYGLKDDRVTREETDAVFNNFNTDKDLKTFPLAGHENYLIKYRDKWIQYVSSFLGK